MTNQEPQVKDNESRVDRCGAVASTVCALHCAACAFIPATFGALGLDFLLNHEAEWALTLFAVSLGLAAMYLGWKRHGKGFILLPLALGIVGLLAARGLEAGGGHEHGHGHETHHEASEKSAHEGEQHASGEDDHSEDKHEDSDHHEDGHILIEVLGIGAGFILVFGHFLNLRELRAGPE